mmetsp:Transcript_13155/g.38978  ORF Transcript_13155/g.38978 Transcript_13155/m.38978 type:complete len:275 (+) Transcript_13155:328-1152(+)
MKRGSSASPTRARTGWRRSPRVVSRWTPRARRGSSAPTTAGSLQAAASAPSCRSSRAPSPSCRCTARARTRCVRRRAWPTSFSATRRSPRACRCRWRQSWTRRGEDSCRRRAPRSDASRGRAREQVDLRAGLHARLAIRLHDPCREHHRPEPRPGEPPRDGAGRPQPRPAHRDLGERAHASNRLPRQDGGAAARLLPAQLRADQGGADSHLHGALAARVPLLRAGGRCERALLPHPGCARPIAHPRAARAQLPDGAGDAHSGSGRKAPREQHRF